jgi:hypothetical protein
VTTLHTCSWGALYRADRTGLVDIRTDIMPVRISRGGPRFWPAAKSFPVLRDLTPDGWMLSIAKDDQDRFSKAYVAKLDRVGIDAIQAQLNGLLESYGRPLALCCFEPFGGPPCHRHEFARWWLDQTSELVPEWAPPLLDLPMYGTAPGGAERMGAE